jgi:hypothetical protein
MALRLQILGAGVFALLVGAVAGGFFAHRLREAALDAVFLPPARDPPTGPRAPTSAAFGAVVGRSSLAQVQALLARRGLDCPDTGARALLGQARAAKQAELAESRRRGLPVDTVSGASVASRRSTMERNPQVRLRCEGIDAAVLSDRPRAPSVGRLLFVFDSPDRPLRHASFQRSFADVASALPEVAAAVASNRRALGPASRSPAVDGLPWLAPVEHQWSFADLLVKVTALNFGKQVSLTEVVEVPLPLRADAPAVASRP